MYQDFFNLKEMPFENVPDPRFLYRSREHDEGLSRLLYVVQHRKGAGILTGVFGCGKTLLARALFDSLNKNIYQIAFVNNPHLKNVELLRSIARQLGSQNLPEKAQDMSEDYFLEAIEAILLNNTRDGKETVIVIDEAHTIDDLDIFEELRLLLNFQDTNRFLLTLLLMGQSELRDKIRQIKPLIQRIAMGYNLEPLDENDACSYIVHRLKVAGGANPFSDGALKEIFRNSGGIPRRINQISDMCLLTAFSKRLNRIDEPVVKEAIDGLGV